MAHDEARQLLYDFGPFRLDTAQRLLLRAGRIVPLTPKAYETLLALVRDRGQIVSKERLLTEVWPDSFVAENVLAVNISTLRKTLGEQPDGRLYIENVPKRGYRFLAPVRAAPAGNNQHAHDGAASADAQIDAPTSLAVLPFVNASADPHAEYLSDGITESIINSLARLAQLRVMARSVVFRYKGEAVDPQQVGRELNVRAVLAGQVLQLGEHLIIRTELVDVADGRQLWGAQYDRKPADLLAVQAEIATEISDRLRLQLSRAERQQLSKRYTEDTEAHRLYLMGRYFWNKRTPDSLLKAIDYFQQASTRDPNYSVAYSGLADCYTLLNYYSAFRPDAAMPQAQAAAEKALAIEPTLAEAHASRAIVKFWYEWDWAGADADFKQALALNPGYATAHQWYCWYLVALQRFDEALATGARGVELDPLALPVNMALGKAYFFARRYDEALAQCLKTLEMDANFIPALYFCGRAYEQQGMYEAALALYEQARVMSGDLPLATAILGHAHARAGHTDKARQLLSSLFELQAQGRRYVPAYGMALVHTALGEHEQACEWLARACDERFLWLVYLDVDPVFDPLRADPHFTTLRQRVGLLSVPIVDCGFRIAD
jgi:TolB-like protein